MKAVLREDLAGLVALACAVIGFLASVLEEPVSYPLPVVASFSS